MNLSALLPKHPWYARYIAQAMRKFLEDCPYIDGSPAKLQCELILAAASKDAEHAR